jgi:hypothetical protein
MHIWRRKRATVVGLAILCFLATQICAAQQGIEIPQPNNPAIPMPVPIMVSLTSIAVPYDPLELVTGDAQQASTPEARAAALDLLEKAHRLSNVRLHAYDLKTSFTSYGSSSSDGRWILEDTSPGPNIYRWTAQGPSFSGIFLNANKLLSSNQPGGAMPLRLAQVRDAMWGVYFPEIGPYAILRVADGNLNGTGVRCVLVSRGFSGKSRPQFSSGRSFDESEYCVNPQSGLLETYSPYPGIYFRFDYANGLHFHEQIIPAGFTITERGKTVIEAKTESVGEPASKDSNLFQSAGLTPLGVGQVIEPLMMVRGFQTSEALDASSGGQIVIVRGMISPEGHFTEAEVLASTNASLDDAALAHANKAHVLQVEANTQSGTTPESRELVFIVQFMPRPPRRPAQVDSPGGPAITPSTILGSSSPSQ